MPLSEEEQRILRQIEQQLQRDHGFARDLLPSRGRPSRAPLWLTGALTVLLFVGSILLLAVHPVLSFLAFVGAIATAVIAEARVREIGEEHLGTLSETAKARMRGLHDLGKRED